MVCGAEYTVQLCTLMSLCTANQVELLFFSLFKLLLLL